jgi:aromatic-L-amino-acid/L-tryptophan decarboxylase
VTDRPRPLPDLDWDAERAERFGRRTVELWREWLERLPELPIWHGRTAPEVRKAVSIDVPAAPMSEDDLFAYLRDVVFDSSFYPGHPRFLAYVSGAGTVPGAAADLLAAGLNMNVGAWVLSPSATEIEEQLVAFFASAFGLPHTAGGLITSGGAMANFAALKAALNARAGWDVREDGVAAGPPLALYLSEETHVVSVRAADMLGLGRRAVRTIGVDEGYRIRVDALREAIRADREAGVRPFAVVATAGTTATGAVDPLDAVAEVCAEEGVWFHVDAAYGGPAAFADDLRPLFAGIERADSIAFDPHKWLYTPLAGGCVLVRDANDLTGAFSVTAGYVQQDKESTGRGLDFGQLSPQFSRGFSALKVWVSLLAHGWDAYRARISHDAALARYLGARVEERPEFELACPVGLSICCFRFVPPDLPEGPGREAYLNRLNERLMTEVQQDGRVFYSNAILGARDQAESANARAMAPPVRYVLRVCIVNFRTEADDLDAVLDVTTEVGRRLDAELRPAELRG